MMFSQPSRRKSPIGEHQRNAIACTCWKVEDRFRRELLSVLVNQSSGGDEERGRRPASCGGRGKPSSLKKGAKPNVGWCPLPYIQGEKRRTRNHKTITLVYSKWELNLSSLGILHTISSIPTTHTAAFSYICWKLEMSHRTWSPWIWDSNMTVLPTNRLLLRI